MSSLAAAKRPPQTTSGTPPAQPIPPEAETTTDRNKRIREIAYFLWLDEGCPEGAAERHWLAAETLLSSDPLERKRVEGEPPGERVVNTRAIPRVRGARAS
jgi:Protein of unknown function (DUF2934)